MTVFKQRAGLLWSARSWGALGLLLALMMVGVGVGVGAGQGQTNCVTPPSGLLEWWPLDETSGNVVNNLISHPIAGHGSDLHNGTTNPGAISSSSGPAAVPGKVAGALQFDGVDDFVEVPDGSGTLSHGNPTSDFTIDAWVKVDSQDASGVRPIVDKRFDFPDSQDPNVPTRGYALYLYNGKLGFQLADDMVPGPPNPICDGGPPFTANCTNYGSTSPNVADGQWHHVAVTVQRTGLPTVTLYVDGSPVLTKGARTGNANSSIPLLIGSGYPIVIPKPFFKGAIDELEIFNRALSASEIQAIYKAGSAGKCKAKPGGCVTPPPDMVAWYPMDEPNGATTVADIASPPGSTVSDVGTPKPAPVGPIGTGPTPVAGKVGAGALYFYGPYVEVPPSADLTFPGDFSIDAWVRAVGCGPGILSPIVDKFDTGTNTGFSFYLDQSPAGTAFLKLRINASTFTSTGSFPATANPLANTGPWVHVAVTVDRTVGGVGTFYINGFPAGTFTPPSGSITNTLSMLIGEIRVPGGRCEIAIDELEIFNRALTQAEIQAIYNAGPAGKCKPQPSPPSPTADLGDAPDSTNNHANKQMTTYTSPPVPARFPTVFATTTGAPPGPKHLQPKGLAWLGKDVSFEDEADLLPDVDGVTNIDPPSNIADRDKWDDGVKLPIAIPMDCGQTQFTYTVTSTAAAKLYVNVWFDFNRDGDWDDPITKCPLGPATTGSFTEWAVQNQLITVGGPGTSTFTTPAFGAANPTKRSDMWMRITLTDQPIAPVNGADGSGPAGGYKYGETEDYLLKLTYSELCGIKFNDLNGNGKQDSGEPGLANWVIEVKDANGNFIGYAETDAQGQYCIVVPSPGKYTVSEQQQAGWTQTAPPSPGTYTVTVPPAHTDLHFGNQQKGKAEICVFKFEDLDGDGQQESNEPGLGGWQFTVSPAPLPPATSPVTTGPHGGICFGVSAPGTYTITEQTQSGWTPTTPTSQTVTVTPGQLVNVYFGNRKAAACDLAIKKTVKPSPLVSGQPATVTITVTNVGTAPCPGPTTVTETVPAGLTLVSASGPGWLCIGNVCTYLSPIPVNGSVSVTYTFNVTAPPGTAIQNCASVSNQNDPNVANNRDCVTTLVGGGAGQCDREIKKTVSPNPVPSGGTVTITLTVTNVGTAPCPAVGGINVADPQPTGLTFNTANPPTVNKPGWSCGFSPPGPIAFCTSTSPLLPGAANAVTITFTATVTAPAGSQIQNCAEVTNVGDANQANNKSCVTINVKKKIFPPDLTLAKLLDGVLRAEQEATYVLRVTNLGEERTTKPIRVSDPLPAGLRFVSAAGVGWSCSASGQIVTCTSAGPIAPNQDSTILLKVRVAAQAGTQITNCATVETEDDANPANNRGCHTGTVQR